MDEETQAMIDSEQLFFDGLNELRQDRQAGAIEKFKAAWDKVTPYGWVKAGHHAPDVEVEYSFAKDANGYPLYERCKE